MALKTDVIVIGAGQAGLATSRCLSDLGIDHVVFERGAVAQRWRTERWNSLNLLTPNWMTRLPSWSYSGSNPDGFMHKDELAQFLCDYSQDFCAPVRTNTNVRSVDPVTDGYRVVTDTDTWRARSVVVATGACDRPYIPEFASEIDGSISQIAPDTYRDADHLSPGGVLVVGASATGIQLADEIHSSGRDVTLAAGRHLKIPRRYRGRDIMKWLDACGLLGMERDPKVKAASLFRHPSFQLIGTPDNRDLNLETIAAKGVEITGRVLSGNGHKISLAQDLLSSISDADAGQERILDRIDDFIRRPGIIEPQQYLSRRTSMPIANGPSAIDLLDRGIRTIVWATGYRREYPWLNVPVLTSTGEIEQYRGVTSAPGLFTMGLPFMRRCNSTFIDGVGADAQDITQLIATHLGLPEARAA